MQQIMPYSAGKVLTFIDALNDAMHEFNVSSAKRQAAFLAQIAQESGELRYVEEIASGAEYEGRADLGNVQPGDGARFKGRGLIQITGRANYSRCGTALAADLIADPAQLTTPVMASRSAAWFWDSKGLNGFADTDRFGTITKMINGGYDGLDNRLLYWLRAREALGVTV